VRRAYEAFLEVLDSTTKREKSSGVSLTRNYRRKRRSTERKEGGIFSLPLLNVSSLDVQHDLAGAASLVDR